MKTLNTYITEWKASTNTLLSIEIFFIYELKFNNQIKIFDGDWPQFNNYKDKVYVNDEHVELDNLGYTTKEYKPGTYVVEIKDIDNITNCKYMFWNCIDLVKVSLFNTSKVIDMNGMFFKCKNLKKVPLFDTYNVEDMNDMFCYCNNLSEQTKKEWSKVYNFDTHKKI